MLPWQWQLHQLNYQKTDVRVVNMLSAIFGDQRIKGFREKGEWSTGIKYIVLCSATLMTKSELSELKGLRSRVGVMVG